MTQKSVAQNTNRLIHEQKGNVEMSNFKVLEEKKRAKRRKEEEEGLLVPKPKKRKTKVEEATDALAKVLEEQVVATSSIKRDGTQIVVPKFMELDDAADAITSYYEQMEEPTEKVVRFRGHPSELLAACASGMKNCFGQFFATAGMINTFFGAMKIKSQTRSIQVGPKKTIDVPYGAVQVPGLPIKINIEIQESKKDITRSALHLDMEYLRKFEPLTKAMEKAIGDELKKNSIFSKQAIDSDFNFLDLDTFPTDKIVYSENCETQLSTHVFGPIRNHKRLSALGLPTRRSVLLHGYYGTGKTLTALLAAKECVNNGWTFLNAKPGANITTSIHFAQKYEPCLVFFEDIDQVTQSGRDGSVNEILNTVDGFISKSSKVMIVMTTNHADKIEKAMIRPGRIDAVIKMGDVDERVITAMVKAYCPGMVNGIDNKRLLKSAEQYTPSFISEACQRSVLYALERSRTNGNKDIQITTEDIESSLLGLRSQFELMTASTKEKIGKFEEILQSMLTSQREEILTELKSNIQCLDD